MDQSHTRAAERCSAPGSTCEVRMPERVACQSALAWARRPRRLTPLPWPAEDGHVAGLQVGRASWWDEAQYDVNFSFMTAKVASLAWMLAMSQRRIHACPSLIGFRMSSRNGRELHVVAQPSSTGTSVTFMMCSFSRVMSAGDSMLLLPRVSARGALRFQR